MSAIKRTIIISESQFDFLREHSNSPVMFNTFDDRVNEFISALSANPQLAKVPKELAEIGITRPMLINSAIKHGRLIRKNKVVEVEGDNGKKVAKMLTTYTTNLNHNSVDKNEAMYRELVKENKMPVMDESSESTDDMEECVAAGAAASGGGTWMNGAEYTVPFGAVQRRSVYQPKTKKSKIKEASDRSQYWKDRWAKQKAEGTVPDRSEYWKERSKRQKSKRKKTRNPNYSKYPQRWEREEEDIWSRLNDNDFGEYFGDHD